MDLFERSAAHSRVSPFRNGCLVITGSRERTSKIPSRPRRASTPGRDVGAIVHHGRAINSVPRSVRLKRQTKRLWRLRGPGIRVNKPRYALNYEHSNCTRGCPRLRGAGSRARAGGSVAPSYFGGETFSRPEGVSLSPADLQPVRETGNSARKTLRGPIGSSVRGWDYFRAFPTRKTILYGRAHSSTVDAANSFELVSRNQLFPMIMNEVAGHLHRNMRRIVLQRV